MVILTTNYYCKLQSIVTLTKQTGANNHYNLHSYRYFVMHEQTSVAILPCSLRDFTAKYSCKMTCETAVHDDGIDVMSLSLLREFEYYSDKLNMKTGSLR